MLFPSLLLVSVPHQPGVRKYVIWCLICGGILCLLGVMFLAVYFLLRSYTSTVGYFETVPPFVPATLVSAAQTFINVFFFWQKQSGEKSQTQKFSRRSTNTRRRRRPKQKLQLEHLT
jgi:hypothetical protein